MTQDVQEEAQPLAVNLRSRAWVAALAEARAWLPRLDEAMSDDILIEAFVEWLEASSLRVGISSRGSPPRRALVEPWKGTAGAARPP